MADGPAQLLISISRFSGADDAGIRVDWGALGVESCYSVNRHRISKTAVHHLDIALFVRCDIVSLV